MQELFPGNYLPTPTHFFMRLLHDKGLLLRCFTQVSAVSVKRGFQRSRGTGGTTDLLKQEAGCMVASTGPANSCPAPAHFFHLVSLTHPPVHFPSTSAEHRLAGA